MQNWKSVQSTQLVDCFDQPFVCNRSSRFLQENKRRRFSDSYKCFAAETNSPLSEWRGMDIWESKFTGGGEQRGRERLPLHCY